MALTINNPRFGNIFVVADTFAELRSVSSKQIKDGYSAIVAGDLDPGDGFGGLLVWNATAATPDDSRTTIAPQDGQPGRWIKIAVGGETVVGPQGVAGPQGQGLADVKAETGSSLVGYLANSNAVARNVLEKLNETVSVKDFGARGDGLTDDTAAIQAAIDYSQNGKARVLFPTGTYLVRASGNTPWAGGSDMRVALFLRSGIELVGQRGTKVLMAPNLSTNAAPIGMSMLFANSYLKDIAIRGIRFDMNGANNKHGHSLANHAHIHVSGNTGYIDDVRIEECSFINTAGVSCIVMGQCGPAPGGLGIPLGSGWAILNCKFINNGTDTVDHSSIFAWAENVLISGCLFDSPGYDPVLGNGNCVGIELHGANQKVVNCTWQGGTYQAIWVSENTTNEARNILIDGNTFGGIGAFGIAWFGQEAESILKPVRGCKVTNNQFTFNNVAYIGVDIKGAITVASPYAQSEWEISGNTFRVSPGMTTATAGVLVVGGRSGEKHDKGIIERNTSYGCTYCVALFTYAAGGIGTVAIKSNVSFDNRGVGAFPNAAGILVSGGSAVIDDLTIENNQTYDTQTTSTTFWGLRMSGTVTRLNERFNRVFGAIVASADYTGLSVGFRYGYNSVAAPTGGTTIDTEARTAIAAIRLALIQSGLLPN